MKRIEFLKKLGIGLVTIPVVSKLESVQKKQEIKINKFPSAGDIGYYSGSTWAPVHSLTGGVDEGVIWKEDI